MQQFRAVVFDLDGTLVDSLADIASAVNSTLATLGRPTFGLEAVRSMVGRGLRKLLESATAAEPLAPTEFDRAYRTLAEAYRARPVVHTRAYPGIAALLAGLGGRARLAVLSNKEEELTRTIVGLVFPGIAFDAVVGARPGVPAKPDPGALNALLAGWGIPADRAAFLGDSDIDMETARRAGAAACGALWGFRSEAELRTAGAASVFADAPSFGAWLEPRLVLDK